MSRDNLDYLRQMIAQTAARIMIEDGVSDYSYAKKKAGRQLGVAENSALPTNTEVEEEIKLYHQLFNEDQPQELYQLRKMALATMELFEQFNPHITGSVLEGTAGKNSPTDIHLFADSEKDVEIFMLNQQIPFESAEKSYRVSDKTSKEKGRKTVPVYTLETEYGLQKLSVFEYDDLRFATKRAADGANASRANISELQQLIS